MRGQYCLNEGAVQKEHTLSGKEEEKGTQREVLYVELAQPQTKDMTGVIIEVGLLIVMSWGHSSSLLSSILHTLFPVST